MSPYIHLFIRDGIIPIPNENGRHCYHCQWDFLIAIEIEIMIFCEYMHCQSKIILKRIVEIILLIIVGRNKRFKNTRKGQDNIVINRNL
jgi:hypothetical protein